MSQCERAEQEDSPRSQRRAVFAAHREVGLEANGNPCCDHGTVYI